MDTTTAVALIVVSLAAVAASAAVGWAMRWRPEPVELTAIAETAAAPPHPLLGRMVVVNTHKPDDQSLKGILVSADAGWLTLRAPSHMVSEGSTSAWHKLPADVAVPERTVSWIIDVPAEAAPPAPPKPQSVPFTG